MTTDTQPARPVLNWIAAIASLVLPGVGQLLHRRFGAAVLFFAFQSWLRISLAGLAYQVGRPFLAIDTATWGVWQLDAQHHLPVGVVFTVVLWATHVGSAYDAWRVDAKPKADDTKAEAAASG